MPVRMNNMKNKQQQGQAIDDLKQMSTIKESELIRMKESEKPSVEIYFCNVCGAPHICSIFCCAVNGDVNQGLGNFTKCVVWFKSGVVRRVI